MANSLRGPHFLNLALLALLAIFMNQIKKCPIVLSQGVINQKWPHFLNLVLLAYILRLFKTIYLFDCCGDCHVLQCARSPARPIRPAPRAIMRRSPPKNAHNINTEKPTNTQRTWRQFSFFFSLLQFLMMPGMCSFFSNACCCLERSAIISKHN